MTEATNEPVFTGTPDQWWERAEHLREDDAAARVLGDWYISPVGPPGATHSQYRVSTPTLGSNESRKAALRHQIERGTVQTGSISAKVRRLIHSEIEPPEWLSAELVIADLEVGSSQRGPWRKTTHRWQLLSDARIAVNERAMAKMNPIIAVITERAPG